MVLRNLPLLVTVTEAGAVSESGRARGCARVLFDVAHRVRYWLAASPAPGRVRLDEPPGRACADPGDARARRYYQAFHRRLSAWSRAGDIRAGVDCHFFRPGPAGQAGESLLHIGLTNGGDTCGEAAPGGGPLTCPAEWVRDLRDVAAARFADFPAWVGLNQPVAEDYLIRTHAAEGLPWVRLAFSTALFTAADGSLLPRRVSDLQSRFESLLTFWCRVENWV